MAVGRSIDYSLHIAHSCLDSADGRGTNPVEYALKTIGPAVLAGGISTFMGILSLAGSTTFIFKMFFKLMEYLNRSTADNLNEQDANATTNNNNTKTMSSPSPSPYALDLREALESGLMTEEEYASAVQEAQRYDSKSPEKKREIADYNEALRIIFADASLKLSDKEQCIVKREYLEEVGLCNPRRSSKRRPSKAVPSIVKVKQEE
ncbi:hypothetical protein HOP50_16g78960 [Chloropicon primus]|uniref:Uncharacterized protein n=1 Tax=Chloropicon primus TaxID=1764295 RepID=A0A5B8MXS1_9CHLO|nr:hypothetical protein A3770_16p78650 [Chloropicon primus]UPR04554.1 hypothetical protein HOP50_16g78960 [Chloropicon primus]|eukprot:QDZ25347.1 hypothetical protein A3770_16p78650 [Chloropicon primus]